MEIIINNYLSVRCTFFKFVMKFCRVTALIILFTILLITFISQEIEVTYRPNHLPLLKQHMAEVEYIFKNSVCFAKFSISLN